MPDARNTTSSGDEEISSQSKGPTAADLGTLVRPLLEALAKLADLESTYLTVFDWDRREQEVRFVFNAGAANVQEGHRIPLPTGLALEAFPGVTTSPRTIEPSQPDSWVAQRLGLKTYVSVPVTVARHRLFGMLCGASRQPRELGETVVGMFESLASIIARHVERKNVEATEERMLIAESQLLSRARAFAEAEHRLKTPLTILQGMTLTLRDRWDDVSEARRTAFHDSMIRSIEVLSKEVERLLREARADVGLPESSPINVDLGPLARELAAAFDGLGPSHAVVADVPRDVKAFVDPTAIYQVFGHLLDNAVKYSPDGGQITIRVTEDAGAAIIDVIDEGVGVPLHVDVFEAFRRGDMRVGQTAGIGLGLHIVRDLVDAMGGTVTARRNPVSGSTFTVRIPDAGSRKLPPRRFER
jgi:signal transduction histidine kinase